MDFGRHIRCHVLQDLRTDVATRQTASVLDGDIARFPSAALAARIQGADAIKAGN